MAKSKRPFDVEDPEELDNVHASRKKRVKFTEEDAHLAEIYNDLADEVKSTRIEAAKDLIKKLSDDSPINLVKLRTAEVRLIKGLCSGRKAARLGFSIALTELFRLKFNSETIAETDNSSLVSTVDTIVNLTKPQGNASAQEKRDSFLGRRFSFQALLQSDVALSACTSDKQWEYLLKAIFALASEKAWLRRESGAIIQEYLVSSNASRLSDAKVRMVIDDLVDANLIKTPEGVGIWFSVQQVFPTVKLPKDIWHHRDPLSSRDLPILTKVLLGTSSDDGSANSDNGSRQATVSFAWKIILSQLYDRDDKKLFVKFWESAVAATMFSSSASTERRALGLQILSLAISTTPQSLLKYVMDPPQIITCILQHRSDPSRYLFDAAKVPLNQMVTRAKQDPTVAAIFLKNLIIGGQPNFDQLTKSKTVEDLIAAADEEALQKIISDISLAMRTRKSKDPTRTENDRRAFTDLFLMILRAHKQPSEVFYHLPDVNSEWLQSAWIVLLLEELTDLGFAYPKTAFDPVLSDESQAMIRGRLMSCLNLLLDYPIEQAVLAPVLVADLLTKVGHIQQDLSEEDQLNRDAASEIIDGFDNHESEHAIDQAFQLLFSLSIIQMYYKEPDSGDTLQDLISCYQSLESSEDSSITLIELLLSFVSKPSALFRKLVTQVFPKFTAHMTAESLQSLTDILAQKEALSGQQALFDQQDANDIRHLEAPDDDAEIDIEDASDVELVNGHGTIPVDAEHGDFSSEDSSSAGEGAKTPDDEEDEAAAFNKELAEALGTAGMEDSDDDGSDMDDEQMMALEPHLASIFKERQKVSSKKSERKDAKENIVNFKNRVLDLLMLYVRDQFANVLALDLLLPLAALIRMTTSKPTGEKAFAVLKQYFELCGKKKELPRPEDHEACLELLAALHEEMKLGGSKLHANACSRAALFLCKILIQLDPAHYTRMAAMYAELQAGWYLDPKSKVPSSVFTEWMSWSISTRKHV